MRLIAILAFLFAFAVAAAGERSVEVLRLQYRSAEELVPILRPLVEPGGAVTGQGSTLVLRAGAANLAELRSVIAQLDRAPRRLLVTVRQESGNASSGSALSASGTVGSGGVRGEVVLADTRNARDDALEQRLQVIEGRPAFIAVGELRPVRERRAIGPIAIEETRYVAARSGFEVVARVSGSEVTVEVLPRREEFRGRAIETASAVSAVRGRLGEWIELASAATASTREERGLVSARSGTSEAKSRIWLKVEELQP